MYQNSHINESVITSKAPFVDFTMSRYYKNDWEFMSSEGSTLGTSRTLVANCMNMPSEFDEMIKSLKIMLGDEWNKIPLNK